MTGTPPLPARYSFHTTSPEGPGLASSPPMTQTGAVASPLPSTVLPNLNKVQTTGFRYSNPVTSVLKKLSPVNLSKSPQEEHFSSSSSSAVRGGVASLLRRERTSSRDSRRSRESSRELEETAATSTIPTPPPPTSSTYSNSPEGSSGHHLQDDTTARPYYSSSSSHDRLPQIISSSSSASSSSISSPPGLVETMDAMSLHPTSAFASVPTRPPPSNTNPTLPSPNALSDDTSTSLLPPTGAGLLTEAPPRRLVGLMNLGNTCFMNSCLQCLLSTPPLLRLFSHGFPRDQLCSTSPMKGQVAQAFADLAHQINSLQDHAVANPASLKRVVGKWAPHFSGYEQHDSQEFLRFLLDGLSEDLNRTTAEQRERAKALAVAVNSKPDSTLPSSDPLLCEKLAEEAWMRYLMMSQSAITDLFCGQLQSCLQCLTCHRFSFCFDPFMDLSVPVPKDAEVCERSSSFRRSFTSSFSGESGGARTCSLDDCLTAFTEEEVLDDEDRVMCENCKARRKCVKRMMIHRFPPILVIHIKRFRFSSFHREKLTTNIDFPLTNLNLSRFATPNYKCRVSCLPPIYDLFAISNHMGGLGGGHYTAHCLGQGQQWYNFNDSSVSSTSPSSISGSQAYLLFYRQRGSTGPS